MSVLVALQSGAFTSTATFTQAAGGWAATAEETFASTATFSQAPATWAAVASEAFSATGSFTQPAAAWSAIVSETFASTGTFTQAAAAWSGVANTPANADFTAAFDQQAATWDAVATGPLQTGGSGGKFGLVRLPQSVAPSPVPALIPAVAMRAAFSQEPPGWSARIAITDDELVLALA